MSPRDAQDPAAPDERDEAVRAAERHQASEEIADPDEKTVVRDPETGSSTHEEHAP